VEKIMTRRGKGLTSTDLRKTTVKNEEACPMK
jgi:hypothetical protein